MDCGFSGRFHISEGSLSISTDSTNDDTVILQCHPFGPNDYLVIHLVGEMLENVLILIGREDLLENVNLNNTHNETIISALERHEPIW